MRLPLTVKERLLCFELVDADGSVIARRTFLTWNGVAEEDRQEVVRENFDRLAALANRQATATINGAAPSPTPAPAR